MINVFNPLNSEIIITTEEQTFSMHPILAIRTEDKSRRTLVLNVIPNLKENGIISELRSSAFQLFII